MTRKITTTWRTTNRRPAMLIAKLVAYAKLLVYLGSKQHANKVHYGGCESGIYIQPGTNTKIVTSFLA